MPAHVVTASLLRRKDASEPSVESVVQSAQLHDGFGRALVYGEMEDDLRSLAPHFHTLD